MSLKSSSQNNQDVDFESLSSLKTDKLTIDELPNITRKLEKNLEDESLEVLLSISVKDSIHRIVENVMNALTIKDENNYSIEALGLKIQNFVKRQNAGIFEFYDRAGKNVFKIEHSLGNIGTQFFKDLITSSLKANFSDVTYHSTESNDSVSVVFRQI